MPLTPERADKRARLALDAANRWTDNIFVLKKHAQRGLGIEASSFHSNFAPLGLDADFDYPPALEA